MLLVTPTMIMAQQRSFTDSLGITHVFTGKPTVAAYASRGALALREFGKCILLTNVVGFERMNSLNLRTYLLARLIQRPLLAPNQNDLYCCCCYLMALVSFYRCWR